MKPRKVLIPSLGLWSSIQGQAGDLVLSDVSWAYANWSKSVTSRYITVLRVISIVGESKELCF